MQYNLIILRKKNNISQQDLADILGIPKDTYGRKERGEFQFKLNEMFLISKHFNETIEEIFLPTNCINNA